MILKLFTVFDSGVKAFNKPFYMRTVEEAKRGFAEVCNDPKTDFFKFPQDYILFELGTFDDSTAKFDLHKAPLSVGLALEFKRPEAVSAVLLTAQEPA